MPRHDPLLRQIRKPSASPLFITSAYAAVGLAWIFLSDRLVQSLPTAAETMLQTVKGALFVLVTALVLFTLLQRRHRTLTRSAQALSDSERQYRAVVTAAAEGIATLDLTGHVTFMNPRLRELLALSGTEDSVLLERVDDADRASAVETFRQALRGSSRRISVRLATADGTLVPCEFSMAPLPGHEGGVRGVVVMVSDLTERIAVEAERDRVNAQLEESERLAALGRLASNLAHEFNNVLMGILPFVEVVRRSAGAEPNVERATESIIRSVERGKAITHDILGFTRLGPPRLRQLDLSDWLSKFAEELRQKGEGRLAVEVEVDPPALTAAADPEQLRQLLFNLARSASDEVTGPETIAIHARRVVTEQARSPRPLVEISVADTGVRIPPADLPHVFEPLFALKGTARRGLGLPLAHQIAVNHGGVLAAESSDAGTTFRVTLPGA